MNLPIKYHWLLIQGPLPRMIENALNLYGTKEIVGPKSNPAILMMAREIGVEKIYKNDDTSWCALLQNYICKISGKKMVDPGKDPYNMLRARVFENWGNPVAKGDERLGDILVFNRPGGAHVGMYIAESEVTYYVLGGNQSNAVTISEIAKGRMIACRRYYAIGPPASAKKFFLDSSGKLSTNEA